MAERHGRVNMNREPGLTGFLAEPQVLAEGDIVDPVRRLDLSVPADRLGNQIEILALS